VPQENGCLLEQKPAIICVHKLKTADTKNETVCLAKPDTNRKSILAKLRLSTYETTSNIRWLLTGETFKRTIKDVQFNHTDITFFSISAE
jgi:hypothetical protein